MLWVLCCWVAVKLEYATLTTVLLPMGSNPPGTNLQFPWHTPVALSDLSL